MKGNSEQGMTMLEVAIALTILLIGVSFIMKGDAVSHQYSNQTQVREQMLFYASGILEAQLEGYTPTVNLPAFQDFEVVLSTIAVDGNEHLEQVRVKVHLRSSPTDPEPVILTTYRVKEE
ncbi:prepilin-type N-terminal cleavage/methylation domain-containing protein [Desulfitobacterium dichloroeliminans LMG P-21439]|uniref:Prepilin-type N-terminal cleavage/methylation domain-containing protein n=1 Tax=Desulfitobacterium dichloroeliminans (strain LMG P-21439 / DCA1) TaxID=871963 RepID=L0FB62_DESDL|nr:prepilin-type N-terminal cleavage/methylation domain-containing protein [Desulfitobacterium dichloroeliminans]AGA69896.1 prepilin-type N-terminal cleavage/methylation domain-containing protein [Desulfitobacterium dichloroeliminans LMG P-21439]